MDIKKNILYVIPSMNSGGVEIGMLELAKKNFEEGNKINMFLLSSGGKMINRMLNYGVKCFNFNVKSKNPITIINNIRKIKKIIQDNNINIVQAESRAPAWSCYFACKQLKIPMITTVHGLYDSKNFIKRLYNSSIFRGNPIIAVSQFAKEYAIKNYKKYIYRKQFRKDVEVIYRAVDTELYNEENITINRVLELQNKLKLPDDKVIITLPARFAKQKGQDYFLKVLKFLNNTNYFCVLAGDDKKKPKYVKQIEKLIYKYDLQKNVGIYGNISDMPALYKLSNVVISSSIKPESFGRIAIETQAMKRIFVGTAIGGTLETVNDGTTGFLVPENNAKLFAKILDDVLLLTEEEKAKITTAGRESVVNNFSIDNMYNSLLDVYNKVLSVDDFRCWD